MIETKTLICLGLKTFQFGLIKFSAVSGFSFAPHHSLVTHMVTKGHFETKILSLKNLTVIFFKTLKSDLYKKASLTHRFIPLLALQSAAHEPTDSPGEPDARE